MRSSRFISTLLAYVVLLGSVLLTVGPFVLMVMTALKTPRQFVQDGALAAPAPVTWENFAGFLNWGESGFLAPAVVTLQMVTVILVGQIIFSILAAFAFAWMQFPGRDALFWVYVATLMVPQVVVVVPLFLMMSELGMRNTFWALVVPFMFASPYAIFLLRENFRAVPSELIDAMRIDGAGMLRVLVSLIVPLNRPIIVTLVLITVVTHWNSFMWPLVITSGETWQVVTVATSALQTQYQSNWTLVMAATTLAMVPLVTLFLLFHRQITRSIGAGTLR